MVFAQQIEGSFARAQYSTSMLCCGSSKKKARNLQNEMLFDARSEGHIGRVKSWIALAAAVPNAGLLRYVQPELGHVIVR